MAKRLILVKDGSYSPNLFADFSEFINNRDCHVLTTVSNNVNDALHPPSHAILSFFNRMAFTFQLVNNIMSTRSSDSIAISHYTNDPFYPSPEPGMFSVLDLDALCTYADQYESFVYGTVQNDDATTSSNVLARATILARDRETMAVKDVVSDTVISPSRYPPFVPIVSLFGMVKLKHLPVYYMIMDSRLLKTGSGLDIRTDELVVQAITEHDGSIRDNIITPEFSSNVEVLSGGQLYVTGNSFEVTLFDQPTNLLRVGEVDTSQVDVTAKSNMSVTVNPGGKIQVIIPDGIIAGFLKIKMPGGLFFDMVSYPESLSYDYAITKIA